MKKNKQQQTRSEKTSYGTSAGGGSDFYESATGDQPLYQRHQTSNQGATRVTARHVNQRGKRKENADHRDKMALLGILKAAVLLVALVITFVLLKFGITMYEDKREREELQRELAESKGSASSSLSALPDLQNPGEDGDVPILQVVGDCEAAEILLRAADGFLLRDNFDAAMEKCKAALVVDPVHMRALEMMGRLYYEKGQYSESMGAYLHLIRIEPEREDLQLSLLRALDGLDNPDTTIKVAEWYLERHEYSHEVQKYLAYALLEKERYEDALDAFSRLLKDTPKDAEYLTRKSNILMHQQRYDDALVSLLQLKKVSAHDAGCYRNLAICYAQQENAYEAQDILGQSAHLFGPQPVVAWVQDPLMDPIRGDRGFQSFVERIGGAKFREYLEEIARKAEVEQKISISEGLNDMPDEKAITPDLLNVKK